ncbi:MAG: 50S ribosomal protein L18 [Patescibacteria group bacterium]|nr:50S ribosomal protein L18 [Patescibacteria group bacterium]
MNDSKRKNQLQKRRIIRVRAKISGTAERPRLSVRRTLSHVYAQIIDDATGLTLAAASDADLKGAKMNKTQAAEAVGKLVAEKALAKKIESVVFDRRDKQYHGRIKALAEAARAAGLKF